MSERKIRRASVRRPDSVFIGAWVPTRILTAVDGAVEDLDLDRSKFLRRALEEKVAKVNAGEEAK